MLNSQQRYHAFVVAAIAVVVAVGLFFVYRDKIKIR
jgi:hypothetical protein